MLADFLLNTEVTLEINGEKIDIVVTKLDEHDFEFYVLDDQGEASNFATAWHNSRNFDQILFKFEQLRKSYEY